MNNKAWDSEWLVMGIAFAVAALVILRPPVRPNGG